MMSVIGIPTRRGGPSASPVTAMRPLIAWTIASYPPRELYGPFCPNPEIEQ